jgi:ribulose-5-phosphate 4-epimerase/fuculose-1-phosphate aldolase
MLSHPAERADLAAALRWAARLGFQEGVDNHFSVAVPDSGGVLTGDRFLVNPYGLFWSEITASSLVLCDGDGTVIEGDHQVESTAFFIHAPMHAARVRAVLHTHMPYATALALVDGGRVEPCQQNGILFHGRIAYDEEYNGFAFDKAEGERMVAALGDKAVLMLGGHGVVSTGDTVAGAFTDLYYLEMAARTQVLAMSTGRPLRRIDDEVVRRTAEQAKPELTQVAQRYFDAIKRTLRREEPETFAPS